MRENKRFSFAARTGSEMGVMRRLFGSVIMTQINFETKRVFFLRNWGHVLHQILTRVKEECCKGEKMLYDTNDGFGRVIVHRR